MISQEYQPIFEKLIMSNSSISTHNNQQTHNLHKDIWYIPDPTLAFVGVPYHVATFSLFEFKSFRLCCRIHDSISVTNMSMSATVLPACRQILTLAVPSGTVGGTTARAIIPFDCKNVARFFGSSEQIAKIGDRNLPVVTMFSGGLDSTYLLLRLQQLGFKYIHAVAVNVGAPIDESQLTKHANFFGATFKSLDGRELLVQTSIVPAIGAHATYMGV